MRFDFDSWSLEPEPDFSVRWERAVKRLPHFLRGTGLLGQVNLVTVPESDEKSLRYTIPILYYQGLRSMCASYNLRAGVPLCIRVGDKYSDYVTNGMYVPFLWHEIGHIVNGDAESYRPNHYCNFQLEVGADSFSAKHVGREVLAHALDILSSWKKIQTPTSIPYLELRVRSAILGSEESKEYLRLHDIDRAKFLKMVDEHNARVAKHEKPRT